MASRGRVRLRTRREIESNQSTDNHPELMSAITSLANTIQASTAKDYSCCAVNQADSPVFEESINPAEADNWVRAVEGALQTQQVPSNQFVEYAAYQLMGEAQQWWQGECRLLRLQKVDITWALFHEAFYKKYLHESLREARELELLQLMQGSMNIAEYTSKFEELCRSSRISQGTPESYEGWKCVKYEVGLREDIMCVVDPLKIRRFSELVDKATTVED
ncbi:uncharacterized protein LOC130975122 [Arachis stenosperma]|uniref:uncharacterized protein LOC130975122 n=1 Tax=Arachis stenosperma TaxID=217475 RepID=UPI0025ACB4B5|nr:uncharacterized protein LOC130975122 [Arachis stenosperma]